MAINANFGTILPLPTTRGDRSINFFLSSPVFEPRDEGKVGVESQQLDSKSILDVYQVFNDK